MSAKTADTADLGTRIEWNETIDRIRNYVANRVGDRQIADDITQDVIVRSISAGALDHVDNPIAWLIRSASNAVIDHYRTQRRTDPIDGDLVDQTAEDDNEATRLLAQCLRPMVDRLDPVYRDALLAVDIEGQTQRQAARLANVSLSGMKSRVQRGRRQLKHQLTSCCDIEFDARDQPTNATPRPTTSCGCART